MSELLVVMDTPTDGYYRAIKLTAILDPKLSWKAKGLQTYIRTRPKDWELHIKDLENKTIDGESGIRAGLNELIENKYLYRAQLRDEKKKIIKWLYISFNDPTEINDENLENLLVGNLNVGNEVLSNKNYSINIYSNTSSSFISPKVDIKKREVNVSDETTPSFSNKSYSKEAISLLEHWNSQSPILTVHRIGKTRLFRLSMEALDRALLRINKIRHETNQWLLFSAYNQIKAAITTYAMLLKSPRTSINPAIPGHKVCLYEFFKFSPVTQARMKNANVKLDIKSWFDACCPPNDPFLLFTDREEDLHPLVSEKFTALFAERVLGIRFGSGLAPFKPNKHDINCFRKASKKLVEFIEMNRKKILFDPHEIKYPAQVVKYVFDAIEYERPGNLQRITPGWLYQGSIYNKTLRAYFHRQNMMVGT